MPNQTTINVRAEKENSSQKPSVVILCSDTEISLTVEKALTELDLSVVGNVGHIGSNANVKD